jgi:hypothetical protein
MAWRMSLEPVASAGWAGADSTWPVLRARPGAPMMQNMTAGGGDFWLGMEFSAIEGQVAEAMGTAGAASASGADPGHYPHVRQVRTGWHQDVAGRWASGTVDEHLWEVFCQQCGDTDGPAGNQPPEVQRLRGPYRHKHSAERAANKHFKSFRVAGD